MVHPWEKEETAQKWKCNNTKDEEGADEREQWGKNVSHIRKGVWRGREKQKRGAEAENNSLNLDALTMFLTFIKEQENNKTCRVEREEHT